MNWTVLFRADGGHELGFGHVKRCLSLASELAGRNVTCKFACRRGSDAAAALIRANGFAVANLPEQVDLIAELKVLNDDEQFACDAIVLDVSHRDTLRESDAIPTYFAGLRRRFPAVVVIDSLMHECLVGKFDLPIDLVVLPHAGADDQTVLSKSSRLACGLDYFVLDRAYAATIRKPRRHPETADLLLVTAGGSDPEGITLKTMKALDRLGERPLEIRIAIGPAFTGDIASTATEWARDSHHRVTILRQPKTLASHMAWCDMAVSASGLTKYELAATGTPAILLSIDDNHAAFSESFDVYGTANHLGPVKHVTTTVLAESIASLLADRGARSAMSSAGRAILDGRGATRLATAIIAAIDTASNQGREIQSSEATG
jgi:UDP-2,4-diacetamido-2,4,6-trideoxy-beta-L-altropyranose hydrolase